MNEQWRPVAGYEGLYEVSDLGRVRRLDRIAVTASGIRRSLPGRVLKAVKDKAGRGRVNLTSESGKATHLISRLVLKAFIGEPPEGKPFSLHNNGNAGDNTLGNLRWGSAKDNSEDSVKHGTHPNLAKTHCLAGHEFTEEDYDPRFGRRVCLACAEDRRNIPLPEDSDKHGTSSGYVRNHCRCDKCKMWRRDYARKLAKSTRLDVR